MIQEFKRKLKSRNKTDYPLFVIAASILLLLIVGAVSPSKNYLVDLGFNGLLVFVTVIYTSFTKDILEDGKRIREIEFMQRQLEYFYYPLLHTMDKAQLATKEVHNTKENSAHFLKSLCAIYPVLNEDYKEIHRYQYLASDDIKEKFLKVEGYMNRMGCIHTEKNKPNVIVVNHNHDDYRYLYKNKTEIFKEIMDFKDELESEIEIINDKLIDLIN